MDITTLPFTVNPLDGITAELKHRIETHLEVDGDKSIGWVRHPVVDYVSYVPRDDDKTLSI